MYSEAAHWRHTVFQMPETAASAAAEQEAAVVGAASRHAPAGIADGVALREDIEVAALRVVEAVAVAENGRFRPTPWKVAPTGRVAAAGSRWAGDCPVAYLYYNSFKAGLAGLRPWIAPDGVEPLG